VHTLIWIIYKLALKLIIEKGLTYVLIHIEIKNKKRYFKKLGYHCSFNILPVKNYQLKTNHIILLSLSIVSKLKFIYVNYNTFY